MVVFVVLLVVAGLAAAAGVPTAALLLFGFVLVTPLERWRPRRRQPVLRRALTADVAHVLFSFPLMFVLSLAPAWLVRTYLPDPPTLIDALAEAPLPIQATVGLVAVEFLDYWIHRAFHEIPVLWTLHQVHHSIETMDWVAGARIHPFSGLVTASLRALPLALIGIDLAVIGPLALIGLISAVLTHANLDVRWRPLYRLWVTPDFHHWHHAADADAVNTNYGGLLPWFDQLFGTYHLPDRRPAGYGIPRADPGTWWGHMTMPFRESPTPPPPPRPARSDPPGRARPSIELPGGRERHRLPSAHGGSGNDLRR